MPSHQPIIPASPPPPSPAALIKSPAIRTSRAPRQPEPTLELGYRQITLALHRAFSLSFPNITPAIALGDGSWLDAMLYGLARDGAQVHSEMEVLCSRV